MSLDIFDNANTKLKKILLTLDSGANVLLHSPGGTGKTFSFRLIASYLQEKDKNVACTATTGTAAKNLNYPEKNIVSRTLHSWAGVGLAREPAKELLVNIFTKKIYRDRWRSVDILLIDEISMLGGEFFDKLEFIARKIRNNEKPFGGIQLVLGGDFLQLPPVKDSWAFQCESWEKLDLVPFIFEEPQRYDDLKYFELLLRIRQGKHTQEDIYLLYKRVTAYDKLQKILKASKDEDVIKPTIIYSKKVDVSYFNQQELNKLPGELYKFPATDTFVKTTKGDKVVLDNFTTIPKAYINLLDEMIPDHISVKVGSQVMLKANLDVQEGLVNGSRGIVVDIINHPNEPIICVKFLNGKFIRLTKHTYILKDKSGIASRHQFPIILAWALTVHKVQGATLDFAICDLGTSIFADGQGYVALSRVRNLRGLFISELYEESFMTNKAALDFEKSLIEKEKNFQLKTTIYFEEDEEYDPDLELPEFLSNLEKKEVDLQNRDLNLRVGRIVYENGKPIHPKYEGFTPIIVMTKSSKYGKLGPYCLKNSKGQYMENIWQFSKVYEKVPKSVQSYSRYQPELIIWDHPKETHIDKNGYPLPEYWKWRDKGFNNEYPVRYPIGFKNRHQVLYSLKEKGGKELDYIEARKEIYLPVFCELVKKESQYGELISRLNKGEKLLILEVDGPHQESLPYYKEKYDVEDDFIENSTILATKENLKIMLNDTKHPFGHGYCLAASLLGIEKNII